MKLSNICKYRNEKICINEIKDTDYISTDNLLPNFAGIGELKSFPKIEKVNKYCKNDILLSNIRPYFKKMILADKEAGCSSDILVMQIIDKNVNPTFLYYKLRNNDFFDYVVLTSKGTKMPRGDKFAIMNYVLEIPSIGIQNKIVKVLENIDNKIKLNNQINDNLQELLNETFINWFCKLEYPNENNKPYKSSGGEMINSILGIIPKQWKVCDFKDIIDFSNGYGFKSNQLLDKEENDTYKVFKQGNINLFGGINTEKTKSWVYKEQTKGLEKFILKKGDILMCMTDMKNSTSPLLGHTALMNVDDEYIVNQRVGLIRCKKDITDYPYVYTMSNLEYFLKDIRSRANSGVQVNLSTNGICETKIILPDKIILDKFNTFAKPLYEKIFDNQRENQVLEQLRDTLLPKLMNGEIDLENIEI